MMDYRKLGYGVLLNFFFVLTVIDLLASNKATVSRDADNEEAELDKSIPVPKMSSMAFNAKGISGVESTGPVIRFLICASSGYRKISEQIRPAITERFPDLNMEVENYEPALWRSQLAKILSYLKIGVIVTLASGWNPFAAFGMEMPRFYSWATSNKIYACTISWFLTGMMETSLTSTGAFEIFYNGVPVWSKLENGRIPEFQEILSIIAQHSDKTF